MTHFELRWTLSFFLPPARERKRDVVFEKRHMQLQRTLLLREIIVKEGIKYKIDEVCRCVSSHPNQLTRRQTTSQKEMCSLLILVLLGHLHYLQCYSYFHYGHNLQATVQLHSYSVYKKTYQHYLAMLRLQILTDYLTTHSTRFAYHKQICTI